LEGALGGRRAGGRAKERGRQELSGGGQRLLINKKIRGEKREPDGWRKRGKGVGGKKKRGSLSNRDGCS